MDKIEHALNSLSKGQMIIITDDEKRENEGDLVVAAEKITPESITSMAHNGGGLICLSMTQAKLTALGIPLMVPITKNKDQKKTAFTISIDAAQGITTGISAADRAKTIQIAIDDNSTAGDIIMPGHIFPLQAQEGGVLERRGHTEASIDLAIMAGLNPSAVICEIMGQDGNMLRGKKLQEFAANFDLPIIAIEEIVNVRQKELRGYGISSISPTINLPTTYGIFQSFSFTTIDDDKEHCILMKNIHKTKFPLVRIHSECLTGDVFKSLRCDCSSQLHFSLAQIQKEDSGIIIYLRQEGRGIGLINKLRTYALQQHGFNTVTANQAIDCPVDNRDYSAAQNILKYLKIKSLRLMTNNPEKLNSCSQIWKNNNLVRVPLSSTINPYNRHYLSTKINQLNHLMVLEDEY
ncbi:Riboflavin biosynthesis protein ribBA [Rickettsiales bacterium Ac37b]|nr:Riboflavin biosynthesis protein ribBA [Rickettsiales bacterium Ac37b]